jgi:hypothetical protein
MTVFHSATGKPTAERKAMRVAGEEAVQRGWTSRFQEDQCHSIGAVYLVGERIAAKEVPHGWQKLDGSIETSTTTFKARSQMRRCGSGIGVTFSMRIYRSGQLLTTHSLNSASYKQRHLQDLISFSRMGYSVVQIMVRRGADIGNKAM